METETQEPPLQERRAMLELAVTNYRRQAYDYRMQIVAVAAQTYEPREKARQTKELENSRANAIAAMNAMLDMLGELPPAGPAIVPE